MATDDLPINEPVNSSPPPHNAMAMVGLVLGILSVTLCCCCGGLPLGLLGTIFSAIGLSQVTRDAAPSPAGKGMAMAGLILSLLGLLTALVLLFVFLMILVGIVGAADPSGF